VNRKTDANVQNHLLSSSHDDYKGCLKPMGKNTRRFIVRKMTMKDYDAILSLWDEGNIPSRPQGRDSKKNIRWQLRQPMSLYFVAEADGEIIGVIFGTHDGRKGWINRLVVSPSYRQRGIAKRLVREVEKKLTKTGIDIVACLIEDWNAPSMQVFERLGYTKHTDIFYYSKRKSAKT
jgi:ribosomal protein S18 acetylase RimI-like enzyme